MSNSNLELPVIVWLTAMAANDGWNLQPLNMLGLNFIHFSQNWLKTHKTRPVFNVFRQIIAQFAPKASCICLY
jgi:hypothetical protein